MQWDDFVKSESLKGNPLTLFHAVAVFLIFILKVEQQIAQQIARDGRAASDGEKKDGDKDDLQPASVQGG